MDENNQEVLPQVLIQEVDQAPQIPVLDPKPKFPIVPLLAIIVVFLLVVGAAAFFVLPKNNAPKKENSVVKEEKKKVVVPQNSMFLVSVDAKEELSLYQYPSLYDIRGVAIYKDKTYISSYGTLAETDKTGKILSYADPKKYFCFTNIIITGDFLYVGCNEVSVPHGPDVFNYPDSVYKIDLKTKTIVTTFSAKDGIPDNRNWSLYQDGNNVWLATFKGVSYIDAMNDSVVSYTKDLGISGTAFSVPFMLVDNDDVWAYTGANVDSYGGLSVYDKKAMTWKAFGPKDLNLHDLSRFDLDFGNNGYYMKKVDGGIEYGKQEDVNNFRYCTIRRYTYATGKFETVKSEDNTKGGQIMCDKVLGGNFPSNGFRSLYTTDEKGFKQIIPSLVPPGYTLNGREYLVVSRPFGNKRYLLSNASVDVLGDADSFPRTLVLLGKDNINGTGVPSLTVSDTSSSGLVIEDSEEYAIVLEAACGMAGYCGPMPVELIDLKNGKLLKEFELEEGKANITYNQESNFKKFILLKKENILTLNNDKNEKVADIDITTLKITVVSPSGTSTPTP